MQYESLTPWGANLYSQRLCTPSSESEIFCESNIADGKRCQSHRKRGEFELLERRMRCAKKAKFTHAILPQKMKVLGTENRLRWNGNVYDSGT